LEPQAQPHAILWEAQNQYVQIMPLEPGSKPNEHPAQVTQQELYDALGALRMVCRTSLIKTKQRAQPVFVETERQILARELSRGLANARSGEDITFALIAMHEGQLSKERQIVAGRAFQQGGKLNLIFGELHKPTGEGSFSDTRGLGYERDLRLDPFTVGFRSKARKGPGRIASGRGISYVGGRNDWIEIDLPTVLANMKSRNSGSEGAIEALPR
jgi:hypothetical protein